MNLILASSSPRRYELLQTLNIPFTTYSPNVDETISEKLNPEEIVLTLSKRKAQAVLSVYPNDLILSADTIVTLDKKILGKPTTEEEAKNMLLQLSGNIHSVYTGVTLLDSKEETSFIVKTDVEFWPLTIDEINWYIATGEPFDKAGGYGIQGKGGLFVKSIKGDYFSVVGLPISYISRILREKGFYPNNNK